LEDGNFVEFQQEGTDLFEPKISCATSQAIYKNRAERNDGDYSSDLRQEILVLQYDRGSPHLPKHF